MKKDWNKTYIEMVNGTLSANADRIDDAMVTEKKKKKKTPRGYGLAGGLNDYSNDSDDSYSDGGDGGGE